MYLFRRLFLAAAVLFVLTSGAALADTVNLQTLPATTYQGYYVGAVTGTLNNNPTPIQFVCDDFGTTTYVPGSFAVTVSTLSDLSNAKWGSDPSTLLKYKEVGWLMSQMQANPANIGPIQFAIWSIFDPSTPNGGQSSWLSSALTAVTTGNYNYSSMQIYTAIPAGSNQEFISGGASPVPLPSALLLLAPGLLGLVGCRKRLIKK